MNKDIVFISGALATPVFWHYQAAYFKKKARLHYVDVLNSSSVSEMAEQFSKTAPAKFIVIAFSMGGYVALELFRHIPHQIEKLVLINSLAGTISEKARAERNRSLALIDKGKFDFLISLIFKNSIYDKKKQLLLVPLLESMAREIGAEKYRMQLKTILTKPDHSDLLPTVKCPVLLLAGKQDIILPVKFSEYMEKHIENAKLIYLNECGHLAPLEQPDLLNKILLDWCEL